MKPGISICLVALLSFPLIPACSTVADFTREEGERAKEAARRVLNLDEPVELETRKEAKGRASLLVTIPLFLENGAIAMSVPAEYGNAEALTRLVRARCADVIRRVAAGVELGDVGGIGVRTVHGVRESFGAGTAARPMVVPIYEVHVPVRHLRRADWQRLSDDAIARLWTVELNLIPQLNFGP